MPDRTAATPYTVRALDASTWDAFAELCGRNGGVMGGSWCMSFHRLFGVTDTHAAKEERVRTGNAHAALVFDPNGRAQGWAQYGSPEELPRTSHRRAYEQDAPPRPDWRITCFYVDKRHRGKGVARAGLEGALDLIAQADGGRIEAISQVTTGRTVSGHWLGSATVELFEQYGFERVRQVGKHAWIVTRVLDPACLSRCHTWPRLERPDPPTAMRE
jgi:GNAT superfamily N-acetyltransferase